VIQNRFRVRKMLLQIDDLQGVCNLRNYPAEIVKELEDLLQSGGSALPDPKRKGFYDLQNDKRTFFIYISPVTSKAMLLASWLRPKQDVAFADYVEDTVVCTA
jgi:hypothetical protein